MALGAASLIGGGSEYPKELNYAQNIFSKDESRFDIWYHTKVFTVIRARSGG